MKFRNLLRKFGLAALAASAAVGPLALASSASTDPVSSLVSAVNFSSVSTDVVTVAAGIVAVLVAIRAATFIFAMVRK